MYAWLNMVTQMRLSIFLSVGSCFKGWWQYSPCCLSALALLLLRWHLQLIMKCTKLRCDPFCLNLWVVRAHMGKNLMLCWKKQHLNAYMTDVTGTLHFHHPVNRKTNVIQVQLGPQRWKWKGHLHISKWLFFVWFTTAIMEPLAHVIFLPWLLAPKENLWARKYRNVYACVPVGLCQNTGCMEPLACFP